MANAKSEASCKLWALDDENMLTQYTVPLGQGW
jgi:hypothetical protein